MSERHTASRVDRALSAARHRPRRKALGRQARRDRSAKPWRTQHTRAEYR